MLRIFRWPGCILALLLLTTACSPAASPLPPSPAATPTVSAAADRVQQKSP